eukprot:gb/GEZN01001188.1/.p1 GENE.gb/GEZN01001188.1/~~gb/GEZN01001188.1/.p1  ORF type:complete len:943 (+),score=157.68 gb/GEZN01001188.1/:130-2958(+)
MRKQCCKITKTGGPWLLVRLILAPIFAALFLVLDHLYQFTKGAPQWQVLFWYGLLILTVCCEQTRTAPEFFRGEGATLVERFHAWYKKRKNKREEDELFEEDDLFDDLGSDNKTKPASEGRSLVRLGPSLLVVWLFGKTLTDACRASLQLGFLGALGYTGWCVSLVTVALFAYHLRTGPYHFESLPGALHACYGSLACLLFLAFLILRLFVDVWANVVVAASLFGPPLHGGTAASWRSPAGQQSWWAAVAAMLAISLLMATIGGLRASFVVGKLELLLLLGGLVALLVVLLSDVPVPSLFAAGPTRTAEWSLQAGADLWAVTLLQGLLSYGLHDPILADRAWVGQPRAVLWASLISAVVIAVIIILFGGYMGDLARQMSLPGEVVVIATALGEVVYLCVSLVVVVASLSSVQAAFLSTTKVVGLELAGFFRNFGQGRRAPLTVRSRPLDSRHIWLGRAGALALALAALGALLASGYENRLRPEQSIAPLVLGTAAAGFGPPVCLLLVWRNEWHVSRLAFHLPVLCGILFGVLLYSCPDGSKSESSCGDVLRGMPLALVKLGDGPYSFELALNFWAQVVAAVMCMLGFSLDQLVLQRGSGPQSMDVQHLHAYMVPGSSSSSSSPSSVPSSSSTPVHHVSSSPSSRLMLLAFTSSLAGFVLMCALAAVFFGSAGVSTLICVLVATLVVTVVITLAHSHAYKYNEHHGLAVCSGVEMVAGGQANGSAHVADISSPSRLDAEGANGAESWRTATGPATALGVGGGHLSVRSKSNSQSSNHEPPDGASRQRITKQHSSAALVPNAGLSSKMLNQNKSQRQEVGWQEPADEEQLVGGFGSMREDSDLGEDDIVEAGTADLDLSVHEVVKGGMPGGVSPVSGASQLMSAEAVSPAMSRLTSRVQFEVEDPPAEQFLDGMPEGRESADSQRRSLDASNDTPRMVSGEITY